MEPLKPDINAAAKRAIAHALTHKVPYMVVRIKGRLSVIPYNGSAIDPDLIKAEPQQAFLEFFVGSRPEPEKLRQLGLLW